MERHPEKAHVFVLLWVWLTLAHQIQPDLASKPQPVKSLLVHSSESIGSCCHTLVYPRTVSLPLRLLHFQARSYVAQADLKFTIYPRLVLNSLSFRFLKYWSYKHVPFRTSYKYYFKCFVHLFGWFDFDFSRQGFSV